MRLFNKITHNQTLNKFEKYRAGDESFSKTESFVFINKAKVSPIVSKTVKLNGFSDIQSEQPLRILRERTKDDQRNQKHPKSKKTILTDEDIKMLDLHRSWKMGVPLLATKEDIAKAVKERQLLMTCEIPRLPKTPVGPRKGPFERKLELKILEAKSEKRVFFNKVESFHNSPSKASNLVQTVSSPAILHCTEKVDLPAVRPEVEIEAGQARHDWVKARRDKLLENEKQQKTQAYVERHENRRRHSAIVRAFEGTSRQRVMLQALFNCAYVRLLLADAHFAKTAVGKKYQDQQAELKKIELYKMMLRQKKQSMKFKIKPNTFINYVLLKFIARWRVKRRQRASMMLRDFLHRTRSLGGTVLRLYIRVKWATLRLQHNIRSLILCKKARLHVLMLKMNKVLSELKEQAKEFKKSKKRGYQPVDEPLVHPKYNIDMNLPLPENLKLEMLRMYLRLRRRMFVESIKKQRKDALNLETHVVRAWLKDTHDTNKFNLNSNLVIKLNGGEVPRAAFFVIYSTMTFMDSVKLIIAAYDAAYPIYKGKTNIGAKMTNPSKIISTAKLVKSTNSFRVGSRKTFISPTSSPNLNGTLRK